MTVLQALQKLFSGADDLAAFLAKIATDFPDLAPKAQEFITALSAAASPANLAALGSSIPAELLKLAHGDVDPRDNPSNSI